MKSQQRQSTSTIGIHLVLLLAFLTALDALAIDMYLPGMPQIAESLNASAGQVQQTLAIFLGGLAIGQGLYGPFIDRFGRRVPLIMGIGIFTLGSLIGALAPSIEWLLAARFIQAIGASAGLVVPRAIVTDLCDLKESSRIFSLLMQIMMVVPILAPIIGGVLLHYSDWRILFWILAGMGMLAAGWCVMKIPDSLPTKQRIPLNTKQVMTSYFTQLRHPLFMAYSFCGGFTLSALFVYISGSSFLFIEHFSLTMTQFSFVFAANSVGLLIFGEWGNRLLNKGIKSHIVLFIGLLLHIAAGVTLLLVSQVDGANVALYGTLLAVAIGSLGMVFGNVTALAMDNSGAQVGTASSLMGMLHYSISALVGYFVSTYEAGIGRLPLAITLCGILALISYFLATHLKHIPQHAHSEVSVFDE